MQKRNTQQRRRAIVELVNLQGEVAVDELAKRFDTSEVTIRKDLAELESNGLLLRRFGGAVLLPSDAGELRDDKVSPQKQAIARCAAELVRDHDRIIIDSGSTTAALLPALRHRLGLVIMTNSLHVANLALQAENEPKLLMSGGTWDPQSHAFQGQQAEQMIRAYNFDWAFLGAAGLDVSRGTTTFNELTYLSQAMADVAARVVIMAESDKLSRKIPNVELPWSAVSILVTDDGIAQDAKQQIEQHGVTVMCAPVTSA
ncbi:DeoR/GlpR family DNA-binding transcription regulator [Aestuariibacter halophilus]|uniref:DeoR/GlpR family DNA-binding transcription regulator n=1 Tax=Fluctibacter halophilus TaxID=226011 RepID=A0ABS8G984_9ALTE|nr:DeoR/GlpR family DNA-binding transcription regulator [Aestuariibacter halophilus]MCC2617127.1 DeoR/GlpR family DNA-binding transcription regulator [Aestuariibacter halophilus]